MNIVGDYGKWFKFINENQHNSKFEICLFIPKSNAGNVLASSNWLQLAQFIDKKGFECMTSFNNSTNTRRGENKRDVKNVFVFSRISAWDWETVFLFFLKRK